MRTGPERYEKPKFKEVFYLKVQLNISGEYIFHRHPLSPTFFTRGYAPVYHRC